MYPRIEIDLEKLRYNAERLLSLCGAKGIEVSLVTKVLAGNREIVGQLASLGFAHIADSRLENLEAFKDINIPKMLLRLPMPSEADRVARLADISLNSEIATIRALDKAAGKLNVKHKIVLMFDLGDLREGVFYGDNYSGMIREILALENIELAGIGTNLTCYGGVIPDRDKLGELIAIKERIEAGFPVRLGIVSGGNSSSLYLLEKDQIPRGINNLRIGEALFLGRETVMILPYSLNVSESSEC